MLKNVIIGCSFVCSLVSITILVYKESKREFIYVDTIKLYSGFEYTKEADKDFEKIVTARKFITDSLYEEVRKKMQELKFKKNRTDEDMEVLSKMQEEYKYKKEQFERENESANAMYTNKIWNQLNTFMLQYGKDNNCQVIFGANGQGNIMYGDDSLDKTEDILAYVNKRYNDKN